MKNATKEKILQDYEKQGNEIIARMLRVLTRAQNKIDNKEYRKLLEKIEQEN